ELSAADAALHRCRKIGFVFQTYNLLSQLTALENVLLPMIPTGQVDRRRANDLLDAVGLTDRKYHRPSQLSGGEQQRVAIARALANDPPLILADEPTGNLDDENAKSVMALLCQSCREAGKTLILVTHDRDTMHTVDTTIELRAGNLTTVQNDVSKMGTSYPSSVRRLDRLAGGSGCDRRLWKRRSMGDRCSCRRSRRATCYAAT